MILLKTSGPHKEQCLLSPTLQEVREGNSNTFNGKGFNWKLDDRIRGLTLAVIMIYRNIIFPGNSDSSFKSSEDKNDKNDKNVSNLESAISSYKIHLQK